MTEPDLSQLAVPGARIDVRVTPRASRNRIVQADDVLRIYVTVVPEGGKANAEVQKLLARALGIPKSRLALTAGKTSRVKTYTVG